MALKHFIMISAAFFLTASTALGLQSQNPETPTIKVDVDLVLVTASVSDVQGRQVSGLGKEQFRLWEDKVEQTVEYFSAEDIPVSVGVVFDVSGSMKDKISVARDAAVTFLKMGSPSDEYFLVEFSDQARVTEDLTTDIPKLHNHLIFTAADGSTALLDGVYLAVEKLMHANNQRKAILLITDGEENHSRYSLSDVKEILKESDVQIFAIGIVDPPEWNAFDVSQPHFGRAGLMIPQEWQIPGKALIEELVHVGGGNAFFPDSVYDLEDIYVKIALELSSQYVLGYVSTNSAKDGKWRKVRVKVSPPRGMSHLDVRTRAGYYAPSSTPAKSRAQ